MVSEVATRVERRITAALILAHLLGAVDVFVLLFFVLPTPDGRDPSEYGLHHDLIAAAVYLPLSMWLGTHFGRRMSPARAGWVREDRTPTPDERSRLLATPLRCVKVDGGLWLGAAVLYFVIHLVGDGLAHASHVGLTIAMGGLTVCAVGYLLVERLLRPMAEIALASGPPSRPARPGVEARLLLAWLLATGVPLAGVGLVAVDGLSGGASAELVARAVLVMAAGAFVLGLTVTVIVARGVARPLVAVRRAQLQVERGDLSAGVRVDDGSEVGLLQSGFNRMVDGLRERERMADLFSRQVGEDVARAALEAEPRLGGEVRDVAVMFVDLVGSTKLAATSTPEHVVAQLNRFFAIVVDVAAAHGGWVNKFQGDAALCVFGAPAPQPDPAACALAAARELDARLCAELPEVQAGIGLSAGPAVAGFVGAERRFEYTVVGDPVNEASRLCDLAKRRGQRLLACEAIVARVGQEEAGRWRLADAVQLRGRPVLTRVAVPV